MADGSWIRIGAIDAHLDASTVNSIIKEVLGKKAVSITQKPELRQAIGEQFVAAVTPFVPVSNEPDKYHLWMSGRATDDGRVFWSATNRGYNYASAVYDENGERWPSGEYVKPSTPGTFPRWVEKVQPGTAEWDAFINTITPIIKEAFKDE